MFGGCQRYEDCRGNPHVLIVGDPGLGKSRMLQACANTTPRGDIWQHFKNNFVLFF